MKNVDKKKIIIIGIIIAVTIITLYILSLVRNKNKSNTQNSVNSVPYVENSVNSGDYEHDIYNNDYEGEDPLKIKYSTKTVKELQYSKAKYVCTEKVPKIEGINQSAAEAIENSLSNISKTVWQGIDGNTSDDEIGELLENRSKNNNNEPIGFSLTYEVELSNKRVITVLYKLEGGLGGASWNKSSGVTFNRETGSIVNVADTLISSEEYIKACKSYVFDMLEEKGISLKSGASDLINKELEKMEGYFTREGIVCIEIPLYEISERNTNGYFRCEIPYYEVRNYIYSNYVIL